MLRAKQETKKKEESSKKWWGYACLEGIWRVCVYVYIYICIHIPCVYLNIYNIYMGVVLNKSSQEPPFRKSFASFRGPIRVAFPKIKNSYQESNIWNQTNSNTNYTINRLLFARMNGSNQNVIVICGFFPLDQYQAWLNAAHFGQDMARVDTSFAHLSRAFREPFARNR